MAGATGAAARQIARSSADVVEASIYAFSGVKHSAYHVSPDRPVTQFSSSAIGNALRYLDAFAPYPEENRPFELASLNSDAAILERSPDVRALFRVPLWSNGKLPTGLQSEFQELVRFWQAEPEVWGFWHRWYEGMLRGNPMPWELLRRVALIPNDDWEKGAARIAGLIAEIEKDFRSEPLSRAVLDQQVAILIRNADLAAPSMDAAAAQIEEAITQFLREPEANDLPTGLHALYALPDLFRKVAREVRNAAAAPDDTSALEARLQKLADQMVALKADLEAANACLALSNNELDQAKADLAEAKALINSKGFSTTFGDAAAKSLGDWKLWMAVCGGVWMGLGGTEAGELMRGIPHQVQDLLSGTPPPKGGI